MDAGGKYQNLGLSLKYQAMECHGPWDTSMETWGIISRVKVKPPMDTIMYKSDCSKQKLFRSLITLEA